MNKQTTKTISHQPALPLKFCIVTKSQTQKDKTINSKRECWVLYNQNTNCQMH